MRRKGQPSTKQLLALAIESTKARIADLEGTKHPQLKETLIQLKGTRGDSQKTLAAPCSETVLWKVRSNSR